MPVTVRGQQAGQDARHAALTSLDTPYSRRVTTTANGTGLQLHKLGGGRYTVHMTDSTTQATIHARRRRGRLVVAILTLADDEAIGPETLREFPLRQIEAILNAGDPDPDRERLGRPEGRDPDEFAQLVAGAYNAHSVMGPRPALAMAREAGVPLSTVNRWIRDARRRGALPPPRRSIHP